MKLQNAIFPIFFSLLSNTTVAQPSNIEIYGYVKNLYMFYNPSNKLIKSDTHHFTFNTIHTRLNFRWFTKNSFTFGLEMRNRLSCGQLIKKFPEYQNFIETNNIGYLNLSTTLISGKAWFFHSMIDRLWIDFNKGKWQITAGRQRINWGVNFIWNPNDIFNTFSYFDFDYEERPGSDGIKIQYYTGETSSAELVYKTDKNDSINFLHTLACRYRFSKFKYDIQFIGGIMPNDFIIGGGWAGDIKGGAFRGEISYFINYKNINKNVVTFSISGDYTFRNSLYLHTSFLFNSIGTTGKSDPRNFFNNNISVKTLSLSRYNLFYQLLYNITPLLTGNLPIIINPCDGSFFSGPSLTYSLSNNTELMITSQLFFGKKDTEYGNLGQFVYLRLKWAF